MLLWLDATLARIDFSGDSKSFSGLENILISCFNGNHLLAGDRETIKALRTYDFGRREKAVLDKIYNQLPELIGFAKGLDFRVQITDVSVPEGRSGNARTIWLSRFEQLVPLSAAILAENLTDAQLYVFAAKHFRAKSKINSVSISLDMRGGGGATTAAEFENIARQSKQFCLCITDSDRLTPHCSASDTANRCAKISESSKWIVHQYCLEARELENVIPLTCYERALDNGLTANIAKILGIVTAAPSLRNYLDIKDGSRAKSIFGLSTASPRRHFWDQAIEVLQKKGLAEIPCIDHGYCANAISCSCIIHSGLGQHALTQVLDWLRNNSIPKSLEAFTNTDSGGWMAIGKQIFEWGVAPDPTRS